MTNITPALIDGSDVLADEVSDRHIGGRELFVIAFVATDPCDRAAVPFGGDPIAGVL